MNREYVTIPSLRLQQNLEMLVFGHSGKPILVFPSSEGRFFDYENFGMIATIAPFIEAGKIHVFCVDGRDWESWYAHAHPAEKASRANVFDRAIVDEVVPFIRARGHDEAGILTHGCSFGAFHAATFYLRHPEVFDCGIALSGNYSIRFTVGDFVNEDVYFNDPLMFMANLQDPDILARLRRGILIMCAGQGPWEEWTDEARALAGHLASRELPHILDLWGTDVAHDWPWWKKQIIHFLCKLDRAGTLKSNHRFDEREAGRFCRDFHSI